MTQPLTAEETAQFQRDGYFVLRGFYSAAETAAVRDAFMAEAAEGPVEGLSEIKRGADGYDPSDPLAFYPRMMMPHLHPDKAAGQLAARFLLDPRLEAVLTAFFGDEPLAAQTMFYFKPAGARGQALHQDNFYLRVRPGTCIAAWLAVDDADAENGGMVVVPGSGHLAIVCPEKADPARFFTADFVPVPGGLREEAVTLNAGDVLFFNGSLLHGSYPNSSRDRFRRSLIAHYVPKRSEEVGAWYGRTTFRGEVVPIAEAADSGPCGDPQAAAGRH